MCLFLIKIHLPILDGIGYSLGQQAVLPSGSPVIERDDNGYDEE